MYILGFFSNTIKAKAEKTFRVSSFNGMKKTHPSDILCVFNKNLLKIKIKKFLKYIF